MKELSRHDIQQFYIRACRDTGWKMDYIRAAQFAGKVLGLSPISIWCAFGDLKLMEKIAAGDHPACTPPKQT